MEEPKDKLAKWAGFQWLRATDGELHWFDANGDIVSPTDEEGNVIWDMNACFLWLVPKLDFGQMELYFLEDGIWLFLLNYVGEEEKGYSGRDKTPALALCKAIEELIGQ